MAKRIFFLLALACAGVLLGASAVLAILNGNVALFAGCATMMLVVAAISLWAGIGRALCMIIGGIRPKIPLRATANALQGTSTRAGRPASPQGARRNKRFMLCTLWAILSIGKAFSKGNTMQKSYVTEHSNMVIEIDLEIGNLIEMIKPLAEGDET
jgi:hypothetical protein